MPAKIKQEIKKIKDNWREKETYKKGRKVANMGGDYKDFYKKKEKVRAFLDYLMISLLIASISTKYAYTNKYKN